VGLSVSLHRGSAARITVTLDVERLCHGKYNHLISKRGVSAPPTRSIREGTANASTRGGTPLREIFRYRSRPLQGLPADRDYSVHPARREWVRGETPHMVNRTWERINHPSEIETRTVVKDALSGEPAESRSAEDYEPDYQTASLVELKRRGRCLWGFPLPCVPVVTAVPLRVNPTVVSEDTEVVSVKELTDMEVLRDVLIGVVAGGVASRASELGNMAFLVLCVSLLAVTLIVVRILRWISEWVEQAKDNEDRPYKDVGYAS